MPSHLEHAYSLTEDDIKELPSLVSKLRGRSDPVSEHLWSRLSVSTQQMLSDAHLAPSQVQSALVDELGVIGLDELAIHGRRNERGVLAAQVVPGNDHVDGAWPEMSGRPSEWNRTITSSSSKAYCRARQ